MSPSASPSAAFAPPGATLSAFLPGSEGAGFVLATVRAVDGERLVLSVPDVLVLAAGDRLVLDHRSPEGSVRAEVIVEAREPGHVRARIERLHEPEKREFPRVDADLLVGYRRAEGEDEVAAFLRGEPLRQPVAQPDPFMNLSVTGLAFDDGPNADAGDTLLLELVIPGEREVWRAVGRVIRRWPIPAEELDEAHGRTHRIALVFERLPPAAVEALAAYTLRVQDAWLDDLFGE